MWGKALILHGYCFRGANCICLTTCAYVSPNEKKKQKKKQDRLKDRKSVGIKQRQKQTASQLISLHWVKRINSK